MSFGAVIASDGEVLSSDYTNRLVEVRVEQTLDQATVFALRFEDDVCSGTPDVLDADEILPGRNITIAAPAGDRLVCLVSGPIEQQQSSFGTGGPGGSVDVRGLDRRAELDRETHVRVHDGQASNTVRTLLSGTFSDVEVDTTDENFTEDEGTLNQHGTDLSFIEQQARNNGMYFWVEYTECRHEGSDLLISELAKFMRSPQQQDGSAAPAGVSSIVLAPDTDVTLRLTPSPGCPHTLTRFQIDLDTNRPTQTLDQFLDMHSVEEQPTESEDPQTAVEAGGVNLANFGGTRTSRTVCAGGEDAVRTRARAALAEAGWFVQATASTTAHLLGDVLVPHQVIAVEGMGVRHSGAYQVKAVTHVINATGHLMDIELRRNALGNPNGGS